MIKNINRIAFEFWAGVGSVSDLDDWAEDQLRNENSHPDACELFNLSYEKAEKESIRLACQINNFKVTSEASEEWAKSLLLEYSKKLLNEEIKPIFFCNLVNMFDGAFLGVRDIGEGLAYYPEWLGDLWNCCDWCDESWSLVNSSHLADEVKKYIYKT